ncbi:unnamed protein product [Arabidopsis lyrata]|uniref:ABC transporter domain-containing protein n=1 Tax=Arabidopsis lyrata subsp. lyrata TaxID=81972 RepID=D7LUV1_ARALL|nr:ABC transporter F family member 4 [Arabidopsis lyrata subsp. lyrata]EFH52516.1 hypothetical protein ARALYDRAFT_906863 [Arabidopsis lyrata subsp. lyrata]CAH8268609.1 unnamed protein product [Arabidopsis lyrata]|eukprot:XP_002876257.1 ABC transporter F family member 4 [Arabidopsis lyrata subsp. lyrata]
MGKNKSEKGKPSGNDSKKEKLSVSAMLAGMGQKKSTSSRSKDAPKDSSYIDDSYLPPVEGDEDEGVSDEKQEQTDARRKQKNKEQLDTSVTDREQKKREKRERLAFEAAHIAKTNALKKDRDAFTVVIGTKTSVLEGEDTADANVKDISIDSFSVSVKGKELLKNVSVKLSHGKRYGLVGQNGTGKSTLLKLLAWRMIPVPKNIDILLVEQEAEANEKTAVEAVVSANEELAKVRKEKESLEEADGENGDDGIGERLAEVYERLERLGSHTAEARAYQILAGLGFTQDMLDSPTEERSGGWLMRISLAKALFMEPSLLLLDEPTNHLDQSAVQFLEEYLCSLKKTTLVVVSHNPDFLNIVCTDIIHLHEQNLNLCRGNYDDFKRRYEQQCKERNKKVEKQEKAAKRAQQKKVIKGRAKATEDVQKLREYEVVFDFPEPTELSTDSLLELIDVCFCYPNRTDFRLLNVDVCIDMETRVAIVGPNGAGKSTLMNLLAGELDPTEGEVIRSQKLRIGRYSQHFVDGLTMEETPVEYLLRLYSDQEEFSKPSVVRAKLAKFGLKGRNYVTPISKLSGGQKARVVFTSISMSKPHILLLDEPTNHLDIESIDALARALDEFTGGVVLVSHDSGFVSRVCKDEVNREIWVVEDGTVKACTLEEYEEDKEELD